MTFKHGRDLDYYLIGLGLKNDKDSERMLGITWGKVGDRDL